MDLLTLLFALGALLAGLFGKLLVSEIQDWLPTIAYRLIDLAVTRLPQEDRERYREEWYAHNNEWPGRLGKVWHAGECYFASRPLAILLATRARAQNGTSALRSETALSPRGTRAYIFIAFALSISSSFSTFLGLSHFTPHWSIALLGALGIQICILLAGWILAEELAPTSHEAIEENAPLSRMMRLSFVFMIFVICFTVTAFFSFVFMMESLYSPANVTSDFEQSLNALRMGDKLAWLAFMIAICPDFLVFISFLLGVRATTRLVRKPL
jgi:hypothetical protein